MPRSADPRVYTDELFRDAVHPQPGQRVLALGTRGEVAAEWAHAVGAKGRVVAVAHQVHEWRVLVAERDRARQAAPLEPLFAASLDALGDATFEICVIDITSYPSTRALLGIAWAAAQRLTPGGKCFAAGPKDLGIISFCRRWKRSLATRSRWHIARGNGSCWLNGWGRSPRRKSRSPSRSRSSRAANRWCCNQIPRSLPKGCSTTPRRCWRARSPSAATIACWILGCGAGIVGMVAARRNPAGHVTMVDADAAALALTRANCARNRITNVTILPSDVTDAVQDERFTLVACNPPLHERHSTAPDLVMRFVRGAGDVLAPGGTAWMVIPRFSPYERRMEETIGPVTEVLGDERYKVLCATRRK